ncbi:MAG: hypothetical protein PHQ72_04725 [Hespellia sp.]|nr:hypothetical protein [Hespellia sp.]
MLSDKLNIPAYHIAEDDGSVPAGAEVIYMGWICAGGIKGYEKAAKRYQIRALCGVGLAADNGNQVDELAKRHRVSESTEVFYLQGGFDMGRLSGVYKLMMKVMRDVVRRSISKKDDVTEEEQIAYELMCKGGSYVDEEKLIQIQEWFHAQM